VNHPDEGIMNVDWQGVIPALTKPFDGMGGDRMIERQRHP
jgi:hypothetical protein